MNDADGGARRDESQWMSQVDRSSGRVESPGLIESDRGWQKKIEKRAPVQSNDVPKMMGGNASRKHNDKLLYKFGR